MTSPLTPEQGARFAAAVEKANAIFALESMAPTAITQAYMAALSEGRVAPEQARQELIAYVQAHKTLTGFIESRPWAVGV